MLTRILDMVGDNVKGKRVDIRSRLPDGSLMYPAQDDGPLDSHVRELERVYFKRENKRKWLYWQWKSNGSLADQRCCYSGLGNPQDWAKYHIEELGA
jgi:hypothetical protein